MPLTFRFPQVIFLHENCKKGDQYGSGGSDVIISKRRINIPKAFQQGILICLTQEAYNGLLVTDKKYVKVARKVDARQVELNLYQTVLDKVGTPVVFNIFMLGALIGMRPMVRKESVLQVLAERFPLSLAGSNTAALELGFEMGCACKD